MTSAPISSIYATAQRSQGDSHLHLVLAISQDSHLSRSAISVACQPFILGALRLNSTSACERGQNIFRWKKRTREMPTALKPYPACEKKAVSHWLFTSPQIKPVSVKKYQLSPSATLSSSQSRQLAHLPSQPTCLWYPSASGYRDIWKLLSSRAYHKPIYII